VLGEFNEKLGKLNKPVVQKPDLLKLLEVERAEAEKQGLPAFKFGTNAEMLAAMGLK
jgi:hypothetical protein